MNGLLARNLSQSDFGIYALCITVITVLGVINSFGMHLSISKNYHIYSDKLKLYHSMIYAYIIGLSLITIFYLLGINSSLFIETFGNKTIINYIFLIAIISALIRIRADYFRASGRIKLFLTLNSISSGGGVFLWIIFLIAIIILYSVNIINLQSILLCLLVSVIITLFISIFFRRKTSINPFSSFKKIFLLKSNNQSLSFIKNSLSFMIINLLFQFNHLFPIWFLGFFFSSMDAAYFFASFQLCSVILIPLSIIDIVFPSDIAKSFHKKDKNHLQILVNKLSVMRFSSSLIVFLLLYSFAHQLILFVYGEDYLVIKEIIQILILYYFPQFLFGPTRSVLTMANGRKLLIAWDMITAILSILIYISFYSMLDLKLFVILFAIISFLRFFIYYLITYFYVGINTFPNFFKLLKEYE